MSTAPIQPSGIPPADQVLLPESNDVIVDGVAPELMIYAVHLAYIHWLLFGVPLIITSGKDGKHAPGSLHYVGRALDFRTRDLAADEVLLFLLVVMYSAPARKMAVFDERALPGEPHLHVEFHG